MSSLHHALALLLLVVLPFTGSAQSDEAIQPMDVFSLAHDLLKKAEKAEKEQQFDRSYGLYRESSDLFDSIARKWPSWNSGAIDFRRSLIRKDVQRVAKLRQNVYADGPAPTLPERSIAGGPARDDARPNGMSRPPIRGSVEERYRRLQTEVANLQRDRENILSQLDEKRSGQLKAQRELAEAQREVLSLEKALTTSQTELESIKKATGVESLRNQVEQLKAQLAQATSSLRQANERTETLLADLEEAHGTIAEMKQREELLVQQRDEMSELIRGLKVDDSTGGLVTENMRLREQLNATRAKLDELQFEKDQDIETIASLRQEVSTLRSDLAEVQRENEAYKQRLAELQGHLIGRHQELEMNPPSFDNVHARAENELLREIIRKQLRQQNHRREAKELYVQELELQNLEEGSDELIAKINELTAETELSTEEKQVVMNLELPEGETEIIGEGSSAAVTEEKLKRRIIAYAKAAQHDFNEGRIEKAEDYWQEIVEFAPTNLTILCNLGVAKYRLNKLEEARSVYEQVLVQDPNHAFGHYMLGVMGFYHDQFDDAFEFILRATEIEPNNAEFHLWMGLVCMRQNKIDEAEKAFTRAVEIRPHYADAHFNLAVLYLNQGPQSRDRARRHYEVAVENGIESEEMARLLAPPEEPANAAAVRVTSEPPTS